MRQVWGTQLPVGIIFIAASFSKALRFMQKLDTITLTLDIDILVYYYTQHLCWTERIRHGHTYSVHKVAFWGGILQ